MDDAAGETREIDRRTIAKGVAWTVPAIIVATAAPAAAASVTPSAVLADVTGSKPHGSSAVTFIVSFASVVGANRARIQAVSGSGWGAGSAPTAEKDVTASTPSVPFTLVRSNNGNVGSVTVTVRLNGVDQAPRTVTVTTA